MEGFPKDIQNLILSQLLCTDESGSVLMLMSLLKTNRMFHSWVTRFVATRGFCVDVVSHFVRNRLKEWDSLQVDNVAVYNELNEEWNNKLGLKTSFVFYTSFKPNPYVTFLDVNKIRVECDKADKLFLNHSRVLRYYKTKFMLLRKIHFMNDDIYRTLRLKEEHERQLRATEHLLALRRSSKQEYEEELESLEKKRKI